MLYPDIAPYATHTLPVDPPHLLYVEESGNPNGLPVLFVHGGPGAGCESWHRRFFDPARYRILLFDQRGAGRSLPHAELAANTTSALVQDMERIRQKLGIDRWLLFGGSWGSTLSLVYAQTHPERVRGLILRGIFLCRPEEIRWFYQDGAHWLFPDYWEPYRDLIPPAERQDFVAAYYRRLTGSDAAVMRAAARAWALWEARTSSLLPRPELIDHFGARETALALARIECHYFQHDSFLRPNQILQDSVRLRGIPGVIVHGRYDVVCPLANAWALHGAWADSELQIMATSGHSALEDETQEALRAAADRFAVG
ncbi:MAG TPA: prolyl aminopeptidase [Acidiferrobacteraceae bacterium]|nr:prolyl aminopeptidase [Acidiferrobacteraceae bacterium]